MRCNNYREEGEFLGNLFIEKVDYNREVVIIKRRKG